jgi:hypothetical protein
MKYIFFCIQLFWGSKVYVCTANLFLNNNTNNNLFPVAPTLKHRASVKCFVSLQFLNPKTVGRAPWMEDQRIARMLRTQDKRRQTSMP